MTTPEQSETLSVQATAVEGAPAPLAEPDQPGAAAVAAAVTGLRRASAAGP